MSIPDNIDLSSVVQKGEVLNRRGFEILENMSYLLENQTTFNEDLTPNSRSKVMGIMFWMFLELQRHVFMNNMLIGLVSKVFEAIREDKTGEQRIANVHKTMADFGIDIDIDTQKVQESGSQNGDYQANQSKTNDNNETSEESEILTGYMNSIVSAFKCR